MSSVFDKRYDVIVCGAGPAGIGAALASARNGAKTLIVEKDGTPGGVSTSGMMSHWTGHADSPLYREVLQRACEEEGREFGSDANLIHPEYLKITYIKMLQEAEVDMLFYTFVCDVIKDGDLLTGIVTQSKSGKKSFSAKVIIDATGDGDVAYLAGAEYVMGRESDNRMQPVTVMFKVGGVDTKSAVLPGSFESKVDTSRGELQALARKMLPHPAGHVLLYRSTIDGVITCNMTNMTNIDGTSADDLTRAEIGCRLQIPRIIDFLREYAPGYERCYLLSAASVIGVRETRHFLGKYTLTGEDVLECRVFEDWVVKGARFNFDIHNLDGAGLDANGVQKHYVQKSGGYYIPFRCLTPKRINGLLLAGRCISGTHLAHSNYRVMPICFAMGAGAGVAAAIAAKKDIPVADVDAVEIQRCL